MTQVEICVLVTRCSACSVDYGLVNVKNVYAVIVC